MRKLSDAGPGKQFPVYTQLFPVKALMTRKVKAASWRSQLTTDINTAFYGPPSSIWLEMFAKLMVLATLTVFLVFYCFTFTVVIFKHERTFDEDTINP